MDTIKLLEQELPVVYGEISSAIVGVAEDICFKDRLSPVYDSNQSLKIISQLMGYYEGSDNPAIMFDALHYLDLHFLSAEFKNVRPIFTVMTTGDDSDLNPELSSGTLGPKCPGCHLGFYPPNEYRLLVDKEVFEKYKLSWLESGSIDHSTDEFDVIHSDILRYISLGEYDKDNKD